MTSIIGIGIKFIYNPMSWYTLIGAGVVIAVISTIVNWYIVLQKEDRKYLKQFIRKKSKKIKETKVMKIIGVIPARYQSSRFPGKPLEMINGRPMVWWVYNQDC